MKKAKIEQEIERLEKKLAAAHKKLKEKQSHTYVACTSNWHGKGCGKKTQIRNLTYIADHYYDNEPYCEAWWEGEGMFDCPKCGHRNRLSKEIQELKYQFGKRVDAYDGVVATDKEPY